MEHYFRPYEGRNPYLFVSYSHADSARVLETASRLNDERYRVWYDEGIPAGSDWPSSVEKHLRSAKRVLFFLSAASLGSDNCFSEISTAKKLKIPVTVIPMDGADALGRWAEPLEDAGRVGEENVESVIPKEFFYAEGESGGSVGRGFTRNGWLVPAVLSALLFLGSLAAAYGMQHGWFPALTEPQETAEPAPATPAPRKTVDPEQWESIFKDYIYVSFPDGEQREAVQLMLGTAEEQIRSERLQEVTELFFCGSMALDTDESIRFEGGRYLVRTSAPARGIVKDLSLMKKMLNLEKLVLIGQDVDSVLPLADLPGLRELHLGGCSLESLSGIRGFASLEILHLEHTGVRDLGPLSALPSLKTVTVSPDMLPLQQDPGAGYEVILINER